MRAGQQQAAALAAQAHPEEDVRAVVPLARVELVLDAQRGRDAGDRAVQAAEDAGRRRRRREGPGPHAAQGRAQDVEQRVQDHDAAQRVHEQRRLGLHQPAGGGEEPAHRLDVHVVRAQVVDDPPAVGLPQAGGQLVVVQRVLLEHVQAARQQPLRQLGAATAVEAGADHHAGDVDVRRQLVRVAVERHSVVLGAGPRPGAAPGQDPGQLERHPRPAQRGQVDAAEPGAADDDARPPAGPVRHTAPSSTSA